MRPAVALGISALVVALVIAAGIGIDWAAGPHPAAGFSGCQTATKLAPNLYSGPPPMCIDSKATYDGTMHTTKGDITFVFQTKDAPKTVNNFVVLAENGYFNGQTFWRVEDWVAQSGDPLSNGRGGPGYSLQPETPAANEQWVPGSLGMARFPDGSISGSQFFITKQAWPGGNPSAVYNHFATVTLGFDIVGQLTTSDRILSVDIKRG
jgi:cyclophilin family peptidyl-prolyl cis-trans isomerase